MRDTRVHFDLGARGRGLCSEWTRAGLAGGPPGVTDAARPGCQNRRFRGVTKHSPLCESEPPPFLAHVLRVARREQRVSHLARVWVTFPAVPSCPARARRGHGGGVGPDAPRCLHDRT